MYHTSVTHAALIIVSKYVRYGYCFGNIPRVVSRSLLMCFCLDVRGVRGGGAEAGGDRPRPGGIFSRQPVRRPETGYPLLAGDILL